MKCPFRIDRCRCVTYCSFRSVNCFSRVVISSRHSILLLSQSSSSISAHVNNHRFDISSLLSPTAITIIASPPQPVPTQLGRDVSSFSLTATYCIGATSDREVYFNILALCWCLRPVFFFPTRAVSIFRHGRANGVLLVRAAAVLLGKIHLHVFVVVFFLLPGVDRHREVRMGRCWRAGRAVRWFQPEKWGKYTSDG